MKHIDGLVQDCSISIANPLEIPVLHYTIAMKVYGKGLKVESKFVIMPTLSSLAASEAVIKATSRTANDNSLFNDYSHASVFQHQNSDITPYKTQIICTFKQQSNFTEYIDGLVQERRNSSALAKELHLPCTNQSICWRNISVFWRNFKAGNS